MSTGARVTLSQAADELGVHYQTAYRWVRRGRLHALKVNGSYEVGVDAIAEVRQWRAAPAAPPSQRRVRSWAPFADRAHAALASGDETSLGELIADLVEGGVSLGPVCDHVLAPALVAIGDAWAGGKLSIADEHRASAVCERAVARWAPARPGRPRGVAVVCSPTEEGHGLPGLMATAVLREHHWRVHHLGVGVPPDAVQQLVVREGADVVVISVAWPPALPEAARLAERLADPGRRVLLGRPGGTLAQLVAGVGLPL